MSRAQPKYRQLNELLAQRIESGEWAEGTRLPSEMQLADEYGVAYMTARSAVSALVEAGQLRRIRGRGTFVVAAFRTDDRPSLGLLLTPSWLNLDPFYFPGIVKGFTERAGELGFEVHLANRTEPLIEFLEFRKHKVTAAACVLLDQNDLLDADALLDRGVIVVAINHYGGDRRIPYVSPDNRGGAQAITRRLIELGHKEITLFAGPKGNLDAKERRRGVREAVREAGLPEDALTILEGGFPEESGYERARKLLSEKVLPTAIVAVSDLLAIGAIRAFHEVHVRVPQDVSVCGFGDFRLAAYFTPSLTTVHLPLEAIGQNAAESLIHQLRGGRPDAVRLPCPVIMRESITAPRQASPLA